MKRLRSFLRAAPPAPPCGSYKYEVGECDFVTQKDRCSKYFYKDKINGKHYKCKNSDSDGKPVSKCVQSEEICSFDRQEAMRVRVAQQELDKFIQKYHFNQGDITQTIPSRPSHRRRALWQHILNEYYSGRAPAQYPFALREARDIFAHHFSIDPDKLKLINDDDDVPGTVQRSYYMPRSHYRSKSGRRRSSTSTIRGSTKRGSKKRSSTKRTSTTRGSTKGGSKKRYTKKHTKRKNKCRR